MENADIGLMGLGVMGENLALNMERNGYRVAIYNRTTSKVDDFLKERGEGKNFQRCQSLRELCQHLKSPRKILLLVKAGPPIDDIIEQVGSYLEPGDILIDAGNSFFKDTIRRSRELRDKGIHFMGTGISGGVEGALKGPSIMPGGSREAWTGVEDIFQKIAAKVENQPCCRYIGPDGAGHYVKMVHNGIEYGIMQIIADSYLLLKNLGLSNDDLRVIYVDWNKDDLSSYLLEITGKIMAMVDPTTRRPILDLILDVANQKGTGRWAGQEALEIDVPSPSITNAVFVRALSSLKEERVNASKRLLGPPIDIEIKPQELIKDIYDALYGSMLCSYAQGFSLLKSAREIYGWPLNLREIAQIWRGGCIIRIGFLKTVEAIFKDQSYLNNLLLSQFFQKILAKCQAGWRNVVILATSNGIPIPGMISSLSYYDTYRSSYLPVNLVQAQRDYFGAHSFERVDKPRGNYFHLTGKPRSESP